MTVISRAALAPFHAQTRASGSELPRHRQGAASFSHSQSVALTPRFSGSFKNFLLSPINKLVLGTIILLGGTIGQAIQTKPYAESFQQVTQAAVQTQKAEQQQAPIAERFNSTYQQLKAQKIDAFKDYRQTEGYQKLSPLEKKATDELMQDLECRYHHQSIQGHGQGRFRQDCYDAVFWNWFDSALAPKLNPTDASALKTAVQKELSTVSQSYPKTFENIKIAGAGLAGLGAVLVFFHVATEFKHLSDDD